MAFVRCSTDFPLLRRLRYGAAYAAVLLVLASGSDAMAQQGMGAGRTRPRMSTDLAERLRGGAAEATSIIVTGSQAEVEALASRHGLAIRKRLRSGAVVEVPAHGLAALAADAAAGHLASNHPVFSQMAVTNAAIGADQVHAGVAGMPGLTGAGVGIAIIDSGIANVPALQGRIVASVDFTDDRGPGGDAHGHGTHVAGIAAAAGLNAHDDTRGVAPGAHLISLKVLDAKGRGYAADVVEAIDWAIENRERYQIGVINLSLGGPVLQSWRDDPLCQAVERAYRAGIVVVASAGNFGKDAAGRAILGGITAPANSPFAITVGALNTAGTPWRSDDTRASYSSMGPTQFDYVIKPDLLAPGNRIRGLIAPGSTLATEHPELVTGTGVGARIELSGTSMAAPVVSGAAATLIQGTRLRGYTGWSPTAFRILLQYSAEPLPREGLLGSGAGALNMLAARDLQFAGTVEATTIANAQVQSGHLVFGTQLLWTKANNILWGTAENILWGTAENILWGTDENILWGTDENILWGTDENILWGTDENILWGTGTNILWGTAQNILWGTGENILWGTGENILWGTTIAD